jgi:hypothetical protein
VTYAPSPSSTYPTATCSQARGVGACVVRVCVQIDVRVGSVRCTDVGACVCTHGDHSVCMRSPQTDGPAIRATTLMLYANILLDMNNASVVNKLLWTGALV